MLFMFLALIDSPEEKALFSKLYQQYETIVYSYANSLLKNELDAESLTVETFETVALNISLIFSLDAKRTDSYIMHTVKNKSIQVIKAKNRVESIDAFYDLASPETPYTQIEEAETANRLIRFINTLSPEQREVILLTFSTGLSVKEIAALMAKPQSTIYHYLHEAKSKIKKYLREENTK